MIYDIFNQIAVVILAYNVTFKIIPMMKFERDVDCSEKKGPVYPYY
jgi:hypothetical protein